MARETRFNFFSSNLVLSHDAPLSAQRLMTTRIAVKNIFYVLWAPVLMPQIVGLDMDPGDVTWNWSVRHLVLSLTPMPTAPEIMPARSSSWDVVKTLGPVRVKEVKSSLSWQTSTWHLQIWALHWPTKPFELSKYELFSALLLPHPIITVMKWLIEIFYTSNFNHSLQVQQTP